VVNFWVAAGAVILLGLTGYAGYLLWQVRVQQRQQQAKLAELEAFVTDERGKRVNSIRILAQGILDDQLSHTEAAIRITALLDILGQGQVAREQHVALFKLADETLHIPRLADWQNLDRKTQRRYDKERLAAEAKYRDFVVASAQALVKFEISDVVK
jgi:hypothetical protein